MESWKEGAVVIFVIFVPLGLQVCWDIEIVRNRNIKVRFIDERVVHYLEEIWQPDKQSRQPKQKLDIQNSGNKNSWENKQIVNIIKRVWRSAEDC